MRRTLIVLAILILGAAGGLLFERVFFDRSLPLSQAQKRAIAILSSPVTAESIGDNRIVAAVQRIEPAVVNIDTIGRLHPEQEGPLPWPFDKQEVRGKGSGVILTTDGYIVTNNHVIEGASRIRVTLPSGQWYYARLIGRDPDTDLAVVRIEAAHLPTATLGNSESLQVGEWSIAVGNPLGLGSSVTVGVISALNRHNLQLDEGRMLDGAIQTDAAINRGNSGGALANINGQLVGINTAILSSGPGGGNIGIGFSIPVNTVRKVVRDLIATGKAPKLTPRRPWLGIEFSPVSEKSSKAMGLPPYQGVEIARIFPNTPAARAQLKPGDVILAIDGKVIGDRRDVLEAVMQRRVGEKVLIQIWRPGEASAREVPAVVEERPENLP